jgi:hypothetical protein
LLLSVKAALRATKEENSHLINQMNELTQKNSDTSKLKKENKSLQFHSKAMGETMVKLQNHIHS